MRRWGLAHRGRHILRKAREPERWEEQWRTWRGRRASRMAIVSELLGFLWRDRLWRLIPVTVILLLTGVLLLVAQTSPVAPLIYLDVLLA